MGTIAKTTVTSTIENTFSSWELFRNKFNLSVSSTASWTGTVTIQRKFGSTGKTLDVDTYTSDIETYGVEPEDQVFYRGGVKTGDYTSGKVHIRLSQ